MTNYKIQVGLLRAGYLEYESEILPEYSMGMIFIIIPRCFSCSYIAKLSVRRGSHTKQLRENNMSNLTLKQEAFCRAYIEKGNASDAYRRSYVADKMKPEAVYVNASKLLDNAKVALRVKELQAEIKKRHDVTVDSLLDELEEA